MVAFSMEIYCARVLHQEIEEVMTRPDMALIYIYILQYAQL
jgi:hypothetical protein